MLTTFCLMLFEMLFTLVVTWLRLHVGETSSPLLGNTLGKENFSCTTIVPDYGTTFQTA